ncbi:MAG: NmrA family NAD(P)-binding protein, partial [Cellulomonadaceae bacterium]|nr:NmrA family NAD(P)-binding protein [Cellulomonadaceae bacterium]
MTLPTLAVTGSTGALGRLVADHLAVSGVEQRLLVRSVARAPELPGAVALHFDGYRDHDGARAALEGVTTLLMVSAAENADRLAEHLSLVDAAADAGVEHVVYTSFQGAAPQAAFTLARDHWATEEHLRASGMAFTFLRDSLYADFLPLMAGDDGVIRGPANDGRVAAVARADVGRAAHQVLMSPADHAGATYDLTGPEALTLEHVAAVLTEVSGRPTRYEPETLDEAYASRAVYGAP